MAIRGRLMASELVVVAHNERPPDVSVRSRL